MSGRCQRCATIFGNDDGVCPICGLSEDVSQREREDAEHALWGQLECARMCLEQAAYIHTRNGRPPLPAFRDMAIRLEAQLKSITVPLGKVVLRRMEMRPPEPLVLTPEQWEQLRR